MKTILSRVAFAILSLIICCIMVATVYPDSLSTSENQEEIRLPVIMYHHMLKESKLIGDYCITPTQFEQDLKYIKNNGYTTISADDLLEFYQNNVALPKKPILLTFDDGYESSFVYAFPLLKKYNMKAIISIIGNYSDLYSNVPTNEKSVSYSHITWNEAKIMQSSGLVEIGNHTYNLHSIGNGIKGVVKNNDDSFYENVVRKDIYKLQEKIENKLGIKTLIFAYPFGNRNDKTDKILRDAGFKIVFGCEEKVNILKGQSEDELFNMKRFNRPHKYSTEEFFGKMENLHE